MYFTDAHEELRLHIRKFLEKEMQPHLEEWEEKTFPDSIFQRMGELGFLGLRYPQELGGQGGDYFSAIVLSEEMAKAATGGLGMAVAVQTEMATPPVFKFGTEEQKRRWLAPAIRGEHIAAIAITEPDAGSDVAGITTTAKRYGNEF
ncbi:MAG: acyl-CoA dehydrogenase, partial [Chloroflexi bacterium]